MKFNREEYKAKLVQDIMSSMQLTATEIRSSRAKDLHSKITTNIINLVLDFKELRGIYNDEGLLPLYHINSEYENFLTLLHFVEDQNLKFGEHHIGNKEYKKFSKEDIEEIMNDPMERLEFNEWIEEGLFDNILKE